MRFDILTLFPEMFAGVFDATIIGRAQSMGRVEIGLHNIRDYVPGFLHHYRVSNFDI